MATTGTVTVSGTFNNEPTGARTFTISQPFTAAVDQTSVVALSSGNNTITVPTGSTYCLITGPNGTNPIPNPSYSGTLTLKGVNGDTGIPISAKYPTSLAWDTVAAAPATLVINASVSTTIEILFA